jgi:hypothetical protein
MEGFRLRVAFSDVSAGAHDFSATVALPGEMVQPLKDPAFSHAFLSSWGR